MAQTFKKHSPHNKKWLKRFFVLHFIIDVSIAIPLFISPIFFLKNLGWQNIDSVASRLVASALFGIGIESYLGRNSSGEAMISMLNLKIIWSLSAIIGIIISILESNYESPLLLKMILAVFILFNLIWIYWRMHLNN
ncbi:MAG: hypothetical protein AB7E34_01460 [Acidaminococcaceae bacterium]